MNILAMLIIASILLSPGCPGCPTQPPPEKTPRPTIEGGPPPDATKPAPTDKPRPTDPRPTDPLPKPSQASEKEREVRLPGSGFGPKSETKPWLTQVVCARVITNLICTVIIMAIFLFLTRYRDRS